jgi:hypothetical protein
MEINIVPNQNPELQARNLDPESVAPSKEQTLSANKQSENKKP